MRSVGLDTKAEAQAKAAGARSGAEPEVGVLVGRAGGGRELVLEVVRTPPREGVPAAALAGKPVASQQRSAGKGGTSASGLSLRIDADWVVEHAAQVLRLLPGGLSIRGLYLACPEPAASASTTAITALLRDIAKEAGSIGGKASAGLVLLLADAPSGRLSLKEAGPSGGPLLPCELKPSDLRSQMMLLSARHELDLQLQLPAGKQQRGSAAATVAALEQVVEQEVCSRVRHAACLVGGQLPAPDMQVAEVAGSAPQLDVDLLLPATWQAIAASQQLKGSSGAPAAVAAVVSLQGALDCRAVVHRRENLASAVEALRADLEQSLRARLELAADVAEAEEAADAEAAGSQQAAAATSADASSSRAAVRVVVSLPRRAFLETAQPGACLCYSDYLGQGEGLEAATARLEELLGPDSMAGSTLACREAEWEPAAGSGSSTARNSSVAGSSAACGLMVVAASTAVALAAWAWSAGLAG